MLNLFRLHGGDDHHGDGRRSRIRAKLFQGGESVHDRHHQVEQDDVWCLSLRESETTGPVLRHEDLVISLFKHEAHHMGDAALVVDHEDPGHGLFVGAGYPGLSVSGGADPGRPLGRKPFYR